MNPNAQIPARFAEVSKAMAELRARCNALSVEFAGQLHEASSAAEPPTEATQCDAAMSFLKEPFAQPYAEQPREFGPRPGSLEDQARARAELERSQHDRAVSLLREAYAHAAEYPTLDFQRCVEIVAAAFGKCACAIQAHDAIKPKSV